jgi:cation:H+ antiporter
MIINLLLFTLAFVAIWWGAGLIISSTSKFSGKLRLSPFAFSFVFLGLLTSTPEFSVGLRSVSSHNPEIFVGNLLGGIIVIFLLIIPLLAIFGNGISLKQEMDKKSLLITLGVIFAPSLFILDKRVTNIEGAVLIILYFIMLFIVQRKDGIFDRANDRLLDLKSYSYRDLLKIVVGLAIVFVSSSIIVEKTLYFADLINISAFYLGLLVIALGTDLPELTLACRSVLSGKREIAMGDYMGAAAASTLLFGLFTILSHGEVITGTNFLATFIFIGIALILFLFLSVRKSYISRINGIVLLAVYIVFVVYEIFR